MKTFNRTNIKVIRATLDIKLKELSEELGITIESKNFSFSDTSVDMKLKATITGSLTSEMSAVKMFSKLELGVEIECGHVVVLSGLGEVKVVEYKPRSPKYPWIVEVKNGDKYKVGSEELRRAVNPIKAVA